MKADNPVGRPSPRSAWIAPQLTAHASLTALTRQYVDPRTGRALDPQIPEDAVLLQDICGSISIFCN